MASETYCGACGDHAPTILSSAPEYARYEAGLGPAGCLLGLALGAALWAVMIGAAWWIWMLLMR